MDFIFAQIVRKKGDCCCFWKNLAGGGDFGTLFFVEICEACEVGFEEIVDGEGPEGVLSPGGEGELIG